MNKNANYAFTLIELLGVLMLLAIIAVLTFPIVDSILDKVKTEAYERQKDSILSASKLYVTANGSYNTDESALSFETLVNAGYLENGEVIDPRDKSKEMPGCVVYNWDEATNQYLFRYSETCAVSTPIKYFVFAPSSKASIKINYDKCLQFVANEGIPVEGNDFCSYEYLDPFFDEIVYFDESGNENNISSTNYGFLTTLLSNNIITLTDEGGLVIVDYYPDGGFDIVLPEYAYGFQVIGIGHAFNRRHLKSVNLSNMTYLRFADKEAFCGNESVKINDFIGINEFDYYYFSFMCVG